VATFGFIGDAHGHTLALERGIDLLQKKGAQRIFFLGDAVGYIPDPKTVDVVISNKLESVMGNHERMLLDASASSENSEVYKHHETLTDISLASLSAVKQWPEKLRVIQESVKIELVHGSLDDPLNGYVYPDTVIASPAPEVDVVVMGHTHYPFVRREVGTLYVNAGSCGMPRDTGGIGSVALLDTDVLSAKILRYDISGLNEDCMAKFNLHHTVSSLLSRRVEGAYVGELVDG